MIFPPDDFFRWLEKLENNQFFELQREEEKEPIKSEEVLRFVRFIDSFKGKLSDWLTN